MEDMNLLVSTALQAEKLQDFNHIYDLWLQLIGFLKDHPQHVKKVSLSQCALCDSNTNDETELFWNVLIRNLGAPHLGLRKSSLYLLSLFFNDNIDLQKNVIFNSIKKTKNFQFRFEEFWIINIPQICLTNWEAQRSRSHLDQCFDIEILEPIESDNDDISTQKKIIKNIPGDMFCHENHMTQNHISHSQELNPSNWFTLNDNIDQIEIFLKHEHNNNNDDDDKEDVKTGSSGEEDEVDDEDDDDDDDDDEENSSSQVRKRKISPYNLLKIGDDINLQAPFLLGDFTSSSNEHGKLVRLSKDMTVYPSRGFIEEEGLSGPRGRYSVDCNRQSNFNAWVYYDIENAAIPNIRYLANVALQEQEGDCDEPMSFYNLLFTKSAQINVINNRGRDKRGSKPATHELNLHQFITLLRQPPLKISIKDVNDLEIMLIFKNILAQKYDYDLENGEEEGQEEYYDGYNEDEFMNNHQSIAKRSIGLTSIVKKERRNNHHHMSNRILNAMSNKKKITTATRNNLEKNSVASVFNGGGTIGGGTTVGEASGGNSTDNSSDHLISQKHVIAFLQGAFSKSLLSENLKQFHISSFNQASMNKKKGKVGVDLPYQSMKSYLLYESFRVDLHDTLSQFIETTRQANGVKKKKSEENAMEQQQGLCETGRKDRADKRAIEYHNQYMDQKFVKRLNHNKGCYLIWPPPLTAPLSPADASTPSSPEEVIPSSSSFGSFDTMVPTKRKSSISNINVNDESLLFDNDLNNKKNNSENKQSQEFYMQKGEAELLNMSDPKESIIGLKISKELIKLSLNQQNYLNKTSIAFSNAPNSTNHPLSPPSTPISGVVVPSSPHTASSPMSSASNNFVKFGGGDSSQPKMRRESFGRVGGLSTPPGNTTTSSSSSSSPVVSSSPKTASSSLFPPQSPSALKRRSSFSNVSGGGILTTNKGVIGNEKKSNNKSKDFEMIKIILLSEPPSYQHYVSKIKLSNQPFLRSSRSLLLVNLRKLFITVLIQQNDEEYQSFLDQFDNHDNEDNAEEEEEYDLSGNDEKTLKSTSSGSNVNVVTLKKKKEFEFCHTLDSSRLFSIPIFMHWFEFIKKNLSNYKFENEDNKNENNNNNKSLKYYETTEDDLQNLFLSKPKVSSSTSISASTSTSTSVSSSSSSKVNISKQTFKILNKTYSDVKKTQKLHQSSMRNSATKQIQKKHQKKPITNQLKSKQIPRISWLGIMKLEISSFIAQRMENDDDEDVEDFENNNKKDTKKLNQKITAKKRWQTIRAMVLGGFITKQYELEIRKAKKLEMNKLMKVFFMNWREPTTFAIPFQVLQNNNNYYRCQVEYEKMNKEQKEKEETLNTLSLQEITLFNGFVFMNITKPEQEEELMNNNNNSDPSPAKGLWKKVQSSCISQPPSNQEAIDTDSLGSTLIETILGRLASEAGMSAATKTKFRDEEVGSVMKAELIRYADNISAIAHGSSKKLNQKNSFRKKKHFVPVRIVNLLGKEDEEEKEVALSSRNSLDSSKLNVKNKVKTKQRKDDDDDDVNGTLGNIEEEEEEEGYSDDEGFEKDNDGDIKTPIKKKDQNIDNDEENLNNQEKVEDCISPPTLKSPINSSSSSCSPTSRPSSPIISFSMENNTKQSNSRMKRIPVQLNVSILLPKELSTEDDVNKLQDILVKNKDDCFKMVIKVHPLKTHPFLQDEHHSYRVVDDDDTNHKVAEPHQQHQNKTKSTRDFSFTTTPKPLQSKQTTSTTTASTTSKNLERHHPVVSVLEQMPTRVHVKAPPTSFGKWAVGMRNMEKKTTTTKHREKADIYKEQGVGYGLTPMVCKDGNKAISEIEHCFGAAFVTGSNHYSPSCSSMKREQNVSTQEEGRNHHKKCHKSQSNDTKIEVKDSQLLLPALFETTIDLQQLKNELILKLQEITQSIGNKSSHRNSKTRKSLWKASKENIQEKKTNSSSSSSSSSIHHDLHFDMIMKLTLMFFPFKIDATKSVFYHLSNEIVKSQSKMSLLIERRLKDDSHAFIDIMNEKFAQNLADCLTIPSFHLEHWIEKYGLDLFHCDLYNSATMKSSSSSSNMNNDLSRLNYYLNFDHKDKASFSSSFSSDSEVLNSKDKLEKQVKEKENQDLEKEKLSIINENESIVLRIHLETIQPHPLLTMLFIRKMFEPVQSLINTCYKNILLKTNHPSSQYENNFLNSNELHFLQTSIFKKEPNNEKLEEITNNNVVVAQLPSFSLIVEKIKQLFEKIINSLNIEIIAIRNYNHTHQTSVNKINIDNNNNNNDDDDDDKKNGKKLKELMINKIKTNTNKTSAIKASNDVSTQKNDKNSIHKITGKNTKNMKNEPKILSLTPSNNISSFSKIKFLKNIHEKKRFVNPLIILREKLRKTLRKLRILYKITEMSTSSFYDKKIGNKNLDIMKTNKLGELLSLIINQHSNQKNTKLLSNSFYENSILILRNYLNKILQNELNFSKNWLILTNKNNISLDQNNEKDELEEEDDNESDEIEKILQSLSHQKKKNQSKSSSSSSSSSTQNQFRVVLGDYMDGDQVVVDTSNNNISNGEINKISNSDTKDDKMFGDMLNSQRNRNSNPFRQPHHKSHPSFVSTVSQDMALMAEIGAEMEQANQRRRKKHVSNMEEYQNRRNRWKNSEM